VKERILDTLGELRRYALDKGYEVSLFYHEEDSALMRFANSAISLNTSERLVRLEITAHAGRRRASTGLITDLGKMDEMKQGVDTAADMVQHAMPLDYDPTIAAFEADFADESNHDPALAAMGNADKLAFYNQAVKGLETEELKLSGIFNSGTNTVAAMTTRSPHSLYFGASDAQVSTVLAHATEKWEISSGGSAQQRPDLDPAPIHEELSFLLERFRREPRQQLPTGAYDIVFSSTAIGQMVAIMNWIVFSGGSYKRGFSCLNEEHVGKKVLSDKFTLVDDPTRRETFPFRRDLMGMERKPFPLFEKGVFKGFTWLQDDADEFGAKPTGHTVMHKSLVLQGDSMKAGSLAELAALPRDNDLLYIPHLHYMNIVNPSKGVITASARFGALLLKKDGSIVVPFNVRMTQSLLDVFGDKVAWLAEPTRVYNSSASYGARNPTALVLPAFMRVNGLEISHSNPSF